MKKIPSCHRTDSSISSHQFDDRPPQSIDGRLRGILVISLDPPEELCSEKSSAKVKNDRARASWEAEKRARFTNERERERENCVPDGLHRRRGLDFGRSHLSFLGLPFGAIKFKYTKVIVYVYDCIYRA